MCIRDSIYVKPVRSVLDACPGAVRALAHITGGGISENLDRALPAGCDAEVDLCLLYTSRCV